GVSGAVARAAAASRGVPPYRWLADGDPGALPLPMVNVLSGGLHAAGGVAVQDVMVVPRGADSYGEAIETAWAVRDATRERIRDRGERPLVADEGGFAPDLPTPAAAFDLLAGAVRDAGHRPARGDVAFAVDVAATHFHEDGTYRLESLDGSRSTAGMVDLVAGWAAEWPVVSVEDPLAEDDWAGWRALSDRLDGVQVVGDDLLATSPDRIARAADAGAATAVLVKPNQAGTVTRTLDAVEAAREHGLAPVVSARSGETCDATIADLAVALDAGQIKIGSLARSERLAKYNRLFGIARSVEGFAAGAPPGVD
ncbi:MAG: enolase C-terminal domain-like protein, partial [Halobacteriaceae archaeon]